TGTSTAAGRVAVTPACSQAAGSRSRSPRGNSAIAWSVSAAGTSSVSAFFARSKKSRPMTGMVGESITRLRLSSRKRPTGPRKARPDDRLRRYPGPIDPRPQDFEFAASWIPGLPRLALRLAREARADKRGGRRHAVKRTARHHAEHPPAIHVALLAELDQIVEQRARHQRPEVAPHMQVGLQGPGLLLRLEAQRVGRPGRDPVVRIGAKRQHARRPRAFLLHLDRGERRVVDRDADLLDRGDEKILLAFALEHRRKQLGQRVPPDRRFQVEPGAVGGDAHVEVAAERRIPQMHRRRALFARALHLARDGVEAACLALIWHRIATYSLPSMIL